MVICKDADKPVGSSWYFGVSTTGSQTEDACRLLNWLYDSEKVSWLYEHPEDLQPFQALGISRTDAGVLPEPVYCRELLPGEEDNPKGYEETMTVGEWLESRNMILKENESGEYAAGSFLCHAQQVLPYRRGGAGNVLEYDLCPIRRTISGSVEADAEQKPDAGNRYCLGILSEHLESGSYEGKNIWRKQINGNMKFILADQPDTGMTDFP